jgi:hypothetical protein
VISKTIIILWTLNVAAVAIVSIPWFGHGAVYNVATAFTLISLWGIVVIPVSLLGLLFKR